MEKSNSSRLPLILLSILLISLLVYLQWPSSQEQQKRVARASSVKVDKVIHADFIDSFEALGTAKANEEVIITSQRSDIIESIHFSDGNKVKKGDVLVELKKAAEQANVRELQANLAESSAQLKRFKALRKQDVASVAQLDEQQAKTDAIKARLKNVQAELEKLTIRAPFDGQLGFRNVSVGASVQNGDIITSLDDITFIKADFAVPEQFLPTISIGQTVSGKNIAYPGVIFTGKVASISPRIDAVTRTAQVRAIIPNQAGKLRPGMLMGISITRKVVQIMQIPESAVIPFEDQHFVFVINDNIAKRQPIVIGRRKPGIVEVVSGLEIDQVVVTEGALKLRDGALVKIKNQDAK
ncbi:efflux RND transporter periplasmic adaptor subunit [Colwelliaceae bacterium BS250]